ncbi:tyrosine-protein kinase transmembrane receptor Ror2-like isoform X1 [Tigriopus californicus]|uniref:tyrosine-protein kinase transmembrane receptor Ror2-like isoform X1 n=1 Tax=Tigriopus californicus TaxID=6832 RepID=UPI0027DA5649|nr:tyrosine-protein kinase transmembrane receptor Ror2-like isoform X1 [Tigriopus californicus]
MFPVIFLVVFFSLVSDSNQVDTDVTISVPSESIRSSMDLNEVPLNIIDQDIQDPFDETIAAEGQEAIPPQIVEGPENTFAFLHKRVELICKAVGNPAPKIVWHSKKDRNLLRVAHNYRIHKNGSLIFRSVEKSDESKYGCVAKNSAGKDESGFVQLNVDAKVEIVKCPDVVREKYGTPIDLQCAAIGDPPPLITWLKEGSPLPIYKWKSEVVKGNDEFKPFSYYSRSVLRINVTEMANYTCYAINQMDGGRQSSDQRSFMVYVESGNDGSDFEKDYSQGYCAPYSGKLCRKFLQGRGLVWFHVSQDNSGGWLNEQIAQNLWNEVIENLLEPCKSAAENLLCKYAFPDCVLHEGNAVGLPLCQEDCIAIRNHYCFNDWTMIEDNKKRKVFIKSRGHFRLPECEKLPKHNNSTKTCTKSSITNMRWDLTSSTCVKGNGQFYQGNANQTKDGLDCQTWFTNDPHPQTIPEGIFPEMHNAKNKCRNPGGSEPHPWCYTSDPTIRWQFCEIPQCDNVTTTTLAPPDDLFNYAIEFEIFGNEFILQEFMSPTFLILAGAVALTFLFILILMTLICIRICCQSKPGYTTPAGQESEIDLDKLPQNQTYHNTEAQLNPKLEKLEFPRNDIIYLRDIGQGAFGRVFQGKAPGLIAGEEFTMVAVKMLKEEASDDLQRDFEKEASLLAEFEHPNIVKLLGVCAIGRPMCLLFEFMAKGDLNSYLRASSPANYIVRSGSNASSSFNDAKITHIEQINIIKQVCNGMVYLSDRKFVHRDLASRNCLMDNLGSVKIADFGLSQKIYLQDYYRGDESDQIPVRWMPLESIIHNKYTVESDVWAFGILLWEIFSYALQPYYGLSHEEVIKFLKEGNVLHCPENTPKSAYRVMLSCWHSKPANRPSFRALLKELETIERELILIQKHYRSQKSILSVDSGRNTPQSPKSFV